MMRTGLMMAFALAGCSQAPSGAGNEAAAAPSAAVPAPALPDSLLAYPGASPVEVPALGGHRPSGNSVAFETDDSPADVLAFYRAQFSSAGVPVRVDNALGDGGVLSAARDGERGVMITVSRTGPRTRIGILRGVAGR